MVEATRGELEKVGVTETHGVTVADSGYWNEEQIDNVVSDGIQVLIPPDAGKRGTPRRGLSGTLCIWRDLKVCRGRAVKEDCADERCNDYRVC